MTGITAVLATSVVWAHRTATFKFGTLTLVALNDATAGFSRTSEGLIEITGCKRLQTNLSII